MSQEIQYDIFDEHIVKNLHMSIKHSEEKEDLKFSSFKYGGIVVPRWFILLIRHLKVSKDGFELNKTHYEGKLILKYNINQKVEFCDQNRKCLETVDFKHLDSKKNNTFLFVFADHCKITIDGVNPDPEYKCALSIEKHKLVTKPQLLKNE